MRTWLVYAALTALYVVVLLMIYVFGLYLQLPALWVPVASTGLVVVGLMLAVRDVVPALRRAGPDGKLLVASSVALVLVAWWLRNLFFLLPSEPTAAWWDVLNRVYTVLPLLPVAALAVAGAVARRHN